MRTDSSTYDLVRFACTILRWLPGPLIGACSSYAHAVAGGAGGGFDSGGDGIGFVVQLFVWMIFELPFPLNLITLAIVVAFVWIGARKTRAISGLNRIQSIAGAAAKRYAIPAAFLKRNPGFDPATLIAKVEIAFPAIQQAWTKQDMAPVRRWISDGVWQRLNTQFAMMRLLGQKNIVSALEIRNIFIDAVEEDGDYDIVHVGIHYNVNDDFVSDKFPGLDQWGILEMLEYWTFLRKAGIAGKDLYHGNCCPGCGAELPEDMGEIARCASCLAVSTLGDYDWVLSEITQADDYANQSNKLEKSGRLTQRIRAALGEDADFSVQLIEDRAANAYLQILAAQATRRPEAMRRFVGDALFERLARGFAAEQPFVYHRLYLNNVTLIDFFRNEGRDSRADGNDNLVVAFKRTAQRVGIAEDVLTLIDQGPYARNEIMILSRDVGAGVPKGALYAHACPACGAPVGDTLDLKCGYCGALLNSTRREWIVTALLTADEYKPLAEAQKQAMTTRVEIRQLDPLFAARDYAFNDLLMLIGIDGEITPDEFGYAQKLSRRMGYDAKKIAGMFDLARSRKLALRLPEDRNTAGKVLKVLEKAALADNRITVAEQALLNEVRQRIRAISSPPGAQTEY